MNNIQCKWGGITSFHQSSMVPFRLKRQLGKWLINLHCPKGHRYIMFLMYLNWSLSMELYHSSPYPWMAVRDYSSVDPLPIAILDRKLMWGPFFIAHKQKYDPPFNYSVKKNKNKREPHNDQFIEIWCSNFIWVWLSWTWNWRKIRINKSRVQK